VILAAGLGTRFGGAKQLAKIIGLDRTIMELSISDAVEAGITHLVLVVNQNIKTEIETDILPRLPKSLNVKLAIQDSKNIPQHFKHFSFTRKKPWGTGHALLAAKPFVYGKAIVITADDYYGKSAYKLLTQELLREKPNNTSQWSLVGYPILDTLSEHGGVNRGICQLDEQSNLKQVVEFLEITYHESKLSGLNNRQVRQSIAIDSLASMTIWGFDDTLFDYLEQGFVEFLSKYDSAVEKEYYLPDQIQKAIDTEQKKVTVLRANESWLGMTYRSELNDITKKLNQIFKGSSIDSCQSNK
jgi:UTP-glucose-1-phosphate uridylyltransferase